MQKILPQQLLDLQADIPLIEPIFWIIDSLWSYRTNLVLYYDSGAWRSLGIHYHLDKGYRFNSVLYTQKNMKSIGKEITRKDWEDLGFEIKGIENTIRTGGIIPPNDSRMIDNLTQRGLLALGAQQKILKIHERIIQGLQATGTQNPSSLRALKMFETQMDPTNLKHWTEFLKSNRAQNPFSQRNLQPNYFKTIETHSIHPKHVVQVGNRLEQWTSMILGSVNVHTA